MIALAKELDYSLVLDGVHEAWLIPEELKKANVQAVLTPRSRRRPTPGKEETTGSSIETSGALEKAGLERIEALGKPFDPEEHEAVMHVEDDGGDTGVRDVVRSGYRFKGRVLRPAMVKVAT